MNSSIPSLLRNLVDLAQPAKPATDPNPCRCVDCGGDQPEHSSDCTYMAELTREKSAVEEFVEQLQQPSFTKAVSPAHMLVLFELSGPTGDIQIRDIMQKLVVGQVPEYMHFRATLSDAGIRGAVGPRLSSYKPDKGNESRWSLVECAAIHKKIMAQQIVRIYRSTSPGFETPWFQLNERDLEKVWERADPGALLMAVYDEGDRELFLNFMPGGFAENRWCSCYLGSDDNTIYRWHRMTPEERLRAHESEQTYVVPAEGSPPSVAIKATFREPTPEERELVAAKSTEVRTTGSLQIEAPGGVAVTSDAIPVTAGGEVKTDEAPASLSDKKANDLGHFMDFVAAEFGIFLSARFSQLGQWYNANEHEVAFRQRVRTLEEGDYIELAYEMEPSDAYSRQQIGFASKERIGLALYLGNCEYAALAEASRKHEDLYELQAAKWLRQRHSRESRILNYHRLGVKHTAGKHRELAKGLQRPDDADPSNANVVLKGREPGKLPEGVELVTEQEIRKLFVAFLAQQQGLYVESYMPGANGASDGVCLSMEELAPCLLSLNIGDLVAVRCQAGDDQQWVLVMATHPGWARLVDKSKETEAGPSWVLLDRVPPQSVGGIEALCSQWQSLTPIERFVKYSRSMSQGQAGTSGIPNTSGGEPVDPNVAARQAYEQNRDMRHFMATGSWPKGSNPPEMLFASPPCTPPFATAAAIRGRTEHVGFYTDPADAWQCSIRNLEKQLGRITSVAEPMQAAVGGLGYNYTISGWATPASAPRPLVLGGLMVMCHFPEGGISGWRHTLCICDNMGEWQPVERSPDQEMGPNFVARIQQWLMLTVERRLNLLASRKNAGLTSYGEKDESKAPASYFGYERELFAPASVDANVVLLREQLQPLFLAGISGLTDLIDSDGEPIWRGGKALVEMADRLVTRDIPPGLLLSVKTSQRVGGSGSVKVDVDRRYHLVLRTEYGSWKVLVRGVASLRHFSIKAQPWFDLDGPARLKRAARARDLSDPHSDKTRDINETL